MKALKFRLILLITLSSFISVSAYCNDDEHTKNLHKEYTTNENTHLMIENKFGKVDINNWEKNLLTIDVEIIVEHSNEERAKKILSYITINFSEEGNTIKAITEFDNRFKLFKENNNRYEINYTVHMPKDIQLTLSNKYGNTYINELGGLLNLKIKYGHLFANKLTRGNVKPLNFIDLGYGKAEITEVNWLKTEVSYSKIEIEKCQALVAETKYSKVYVDKGSSIVAESKYDTYRIGSLNNFISEAAYTSFKFDKIAKKLKLEVRYGGCKVGYIPKNFSLVQIDGRYTGISLGIDPDASYELKGEVSYGSINYPSNSRVNSIKKTTSHSVSGIIGDDKNTKSKVIIESDYGSIKLVD